MEPDAPPHEKVARAIQGVGRRVGATVQKLQGMDRAIQARRSSARRRAAAGSSGEHAATRHPLEGAFASLSSALAGKGVRVPGLDPGRAPHHHPLFAAISSVFGGRQEIKAEVRIEKVASEPYHYEGELEKIFRKYDTDSNGSLDKREVQAALLSLQLPSCDDYCNDLWDQYDRDRNGLIDYTEFSSYVRGKEREMLRAFNEIDVDNDGQYELQSALGKIGIPATEKDASQMVQLLDSNSDGSVSYDEFREYLVMLPRSQLRENSTWCWMGSAVDRVVMSPRSQPRVQLLSGGMAGAISKSVVAPLERVRTVMMGQAGFDKQGFVETFRGVLQKDGVKGFFRGNLVSCVKQVPASSIQFTVFDNCKDYFLMRSGAGDLSVPERLASGSLAGLVATLICYPLDTIKTQMSIGGGLKGGMVDVARQICREQGTWALYKGLQPSLLSDIVGNGLGFCLYDMGNSLFKKVVKRKPRPHEKGFVGGCSSMVCMTMTMPLEVVMTRMRAQGAAGRPLLYKNMFDCIYQISRQEGVKTLWRGSLGSYLKVFPQIALVYFLYEELSRRLGVGGITKYDGARNMIRSRNTRSPPITSQEKKKAFA